MKASKQKLWFYFILSARVWTGCILLAYGIFKLTGNQFHASSDLLATKVQDANLFKLSWFLASHQPFSFFIGIHKFW